LSANNDELTVPRAETGSGWAVLAEAPLQATPELSPKLNPR